MSLKTCTYWRLQPFSFTIPHIFLGILWGVSSLALAPSNECKPTLTLGLMSSCSLTPKLSLLGDVESARHFSNHLLQKFNTYFCQSIVCGEIGRRDYMVTKISGTEVRKGISICRSAVADYFWGPWYFAATWLYFQWSSAEISLSISIM